MNQFFKILISFLLGFLLAQEIYMQPGDSEDQESQAGKDESVEAIESASDEVNSNPSSKYELNKYDEHFLISYGKINGNSIVAKKALLVPMGNIEYQSYQDLFQIIDRAEKNIVAKNAGSTEFQRENLATERKELILQLIQKTWDKDELTKLVGY